MLVEARLEKLIQEVPTNLRDVNNGGRSLSSEDRDALVQRRAAAVELLRQGLTRQQVQKSLRERDGVGISSRFLNKAMKIVRGYKRQEPTTFQARRDYAKKQMSLPEGERPSRKVLLADMRKRFNGKCIAASVILDIRRELGLAEKRSAKKAYAESKLPRTPTEKLPLVAEDARSRISLESGIVVASMISRILRPYAPDARAEILRGAGALLRELE